MRSGWSGRPKRSGPRFGIGQEAQAAAWNLRRVWPDKVSLSADDDARCGELMAHHDKVAEQHKGRGDDRPEDVAAELDRIEAELAELEAWQPEVVAVGGVILTIAVDGSLRIEPGYVRANDEPVAPAQDDKAQEGKEAEDGTTETESGSTVTPFLPMPEPEDKAPALSATLLTELEAHRTAGLQAALRLAARACLASTALFGDVKTLLVRQAKGLWNPRSSRFAPVLA